MRTSKFTFIHAVLMLIVCGISFARTPQHNSSEKIQMFAQQIAVSEITVGRLAQSPQTV
jgi:hypothetical protein